MLPLSLSRSLSFPESGAERRYLCIKLQVIKCACQDHAAVDAVVGSASTSADSCNEQRTDTLKLAQAEIVVFATLYTLHCFSVPKYSLSFACLCWYYI